MIARAKGEFARATAAFSMAGTILEQRLLIKPEDTRTIAVLAQVDAGWNPLRGDPRFEALA